MSETGVIKFHCQWTKGNPLAEESIRELNEWRDILHQRGFIRAYQNGIGYGNISVRFKQNQFIITGSATGGIKKLSGEHYTKVTAFDLDRNSVTAEGPMLASSESLTHAAIYECDAGVNAVIHIHDTNLWKTLINKVPTTNRAVEYGTPDMAKEILRLFKKTDLARQKILVMAGHEDGIIAFGSSIAEAGHSLIRVMGKLHTPIPE